ncbi:phage integrase family protein [Roseobacter sp. AzwK-3b]|uniref:tyrosine-type recombinase/integrase n=1 Tax=Roseobacter sp. AzwK-3b TaxID=351016 RepID=UPI0001568D27|nr:tyrosine-type recombinase/integrase [Roseobacter sp. AzwK-3b]EDM72513.1 phage integrase family protein [Roseobacter sp. AzwK-3b]
MVALSPNTHVLLDGEVKVYKRGNSKRWQATFKIDQHWVRISTGKTDLEEAKTVARDQYLEYRFRAKHDLPVVTKRFEDVAKLAIADMQRQLDAEAGRKVYKDYIKALNLYFIPFFGKTFITNIDHEKIQDFNRWRVQQLGREPKASTLNTHNSAMNRVFDEAVARGFIAQGKVPILSNKGEGAERRPDFSRDEYRTLIRKLPHWIDKGKGGKSRDMRYLLRDYVLILANTGMRHGTEAQNLRWKHVTIFEDGGLEYVEFYLHGKTKPHEAIGRAGTIGYLKRIHARTDAIKDIDFYDMLKQKLDLPVFCLPDGTVTEHLRQTFKAFLKDADLLKCPKTGKDRTLYSLRHTYATFALVNDGMDIHALAKQMGTSIGMIERHYSHLEPRMKKEMFTGKRYDLPADEFKKRYKSE